VESTHPLATDDEFCAFAGITKQQSAQLRYLGKGPRFIRVTGRQIRYAWSDIEEWCAVRTVSRSDERADVPASRAENKPLDYALNRTRSRRQAAGKELTD
jgi:hypothetical protein